MRKHSPWQSIKRDNEAERLLAECLAKTQERIAQTRDSGTGGGGARPEQKEWENELALKPKLRDKVKEQIDDLLGSDDQNLKNDLTVHLGSEFLKAAEQGNANTVLAFIREGFPVTWQDPANGETALHIAAACQARDVLRVLLKTGQCDYLLRDKKGRLPSELAFLYGEDLTVARLLRIHERKQADAQGIKLTRRPSKK